MSKRTPTTPKDKGRKKPHSPAGRSRQAASVAAPESGATMRDGPPHPRRPSPSAYVSLVEHAVHGIFRSNRDDQFLTVNPALVEMLGYASEDELLAMTSPRQLLMNAADHDRLVERFRQTGRIAGLQLTWKRKDGSPITVRLSGRPATDDRGMMDGFELIVEDVHERSILETQLQQAQKMEAIGQLTGGIAHDFNNLLTVILATADLLAEQIGADEAEIQADLQNIRSAAQHGADMARKLLGFSRRAEMVFAPVDLSRVVANAVDLLRPLLPEHIDALVLRDEEVGVVRVDAGAIEQIVMNLITNARDAMPGGGTLRIETRRAWLDEEHQRTHGWGDVGEYAALIVTDSGSGMDAETTRRIFEPFFTTKQKGAGTGLGMSMVFGLVKQHGGFVEIYSEPAQGTTVMAYFPVMSTDVAANFPAVTQQSPRGSETVLIVEDNEAIRDSAKRILDGLGYRSFTASDGELALEWIRERNVPIDLVVTDIGMPRLSGTELHRIARQEGARMPFLFMSAYRANESRGAARPDPALPFLYKPWTRAEFAIRVREVLDQSAARTVLSGRTVLLVDDDQRTRTVLRKRLEEVGCVVREADDAGAALGMFRDARPDIVLTDLIMPASTGAALIKAIRREAPGHPVVAISGSLAGDRDALLEEARQLGATRALPKPFTATQLVMALRAALVAQPEDNRAKESPVSHG